MCETRRSELRRAHIQALRAAQARGEDVAEDMPSFEEQLPRQVHWSVRKIARLLAVLERLSGEAVRAHRRLLRREGPETDAAARAMTAAGNSALTENEAIQLGLREGLLTRSQRRTLVGVCVGAVQLGISAGGAVTKV